MKKRLIVIFLLTISYISPTCANFFVFMLGKPINNSIFYLPVGTHTRTGHRQLKYFQLAGGVYQSFYVMTFINSFNDRVISAGMERYFYQYRRLFFGYGFGLMVGYQGNLSTVHGIPFKNSFLFKHNINPVLVGLLDLKICTHLKLSFVLAPLVIAGGIRFDF